ncbi:tyrosine--tRNA ligase [Flavobacteriaceae bacterium]|jgi:tyrosyl-tRNA synthetase|nr:tyrosine--tRNA ligase [Flavobacteriaceae bacterium]MDC0916365.1 tyrosine--tRNA ligase [Flavobacteriaceae bacterium]MDC3329864.1 tyrosine--tRNA ligase [Flavobacteriaceae bacterium]
MPTNFVQELQWRGLLHDLMPDTESFLSSTPTKGYIGFDPTADSLHIGSLVQIIILMHFQKAGHTPIVLVGGATGMIGDPSGKSNERNLLDQQTLEKNCRGIQTQLEQFLNFDSSIQNPAVVVNNYDWMKSYTLIDFSRDIGKHLTVNYMMAKESVKKRLGADSKVGMSFTEFTYQLLQGYDFLHLYNTLECKLQMGGSDQWGNITTGTELIRRKEGGKAYALTCPLIKKADGSKFGKTEEGNVWLDKSRTSPYKFYQFWLNTSDEDALSYIKIFTFLPREVIEEKIQEHQTAPHLRLLQKTIAEEVTILVHGKEAYLNAVEASQILFGKTTGDSLQKLDSQTFLELFEGVPQAEVSRSLIDGGLDLVAALATETDFLSSNGEARRALKENAISVNQVKVDENFTLGVKDLIAAQYILLRRGKKNYFILKVTS